MCEAKMIKQKKTKNGPYNTTQKTEDQETRTPPKTGGELRCCGSWAVPLFIFRRTNIKDIKEHI